MGRGDEFNLGLRKTQQTERWGKQGITSLWVELGRVDRLNGEVEELEGI